MVATLVRLKLTLLRRSYTTGGAGRIFGAVVGVFWTLVLTALAVIGLIAARTATVADARAWVISGFVTLTVGWVVMPLLLFGTDDTLDPSRFALLPLRARALQPGLLASGLLGLPGIALVILCLTQIITWSRTPSSIALAIIAAPLGIATCFLLSRIVTTAFSDALRSRRARDFAAVVLGVFALGFGLINQAISAAAQHGVSRFDNVAHRAGDIASWTPLGWVWAAPADAAAGDLVPALIKLTLATALVGAMWWGWGRLLTHALETTSGDTSGGEIASRGLLDHLTGSTPSGAVMGRCLRYWRRDPRYLTALTSMLIAPILMCFSLRGTGEGVFAAPVFMAAMVGPTLLSDLAYDNSAFWIHVVAPMPMRADRIGRAKALAVVIIPILTVTMLALAAVTGRWDALGWCAAVCIAALGGAMGISLSQGAKTPGKAPAPGASAFGRGASGGAEILFVVFGCWLATALLCAPVIVLCALGLTWVALPVAVATAATSLTLGIRGGAARMEQTLPELLTKVST